MRSGFAHTCAWLHSHPPLSSGDGWQASKGGIDSKSKSGKHITYIPRPSKCTIWLRPRDSPAKGHLLSPFPWRELRPLCATNNLVPKVSSLPQHWWPSGVAFSCQKSWSVSRKASFPTMSRGCCNEEQLSGLTKMLCSLRQPQPKMWWPAFSGQAQKEWEENQKNLKVAWNFKGSTWEMGKEGRMALASWALPGRVWTWDATENRLWQRRPNRHRSQRLVQTAPALTPPPLLTHFVCPPLSAPISPNPFYIPRACTEQRDTLVWTMEGRRW